MLLDYMEDYGWSIKELFEREGKVKKVEGKLIVVRYEEECDCVYGYRDGEEEEYELVLVRDGDEVEVILDGKVIYKGSDEVLIGDVLASHVGCEE